MKNFRNWAFGMAVGIFVAGAVFVEAQGTGFLSLLISESSGAVQARGLNNWGRAITVGFGTALPTGSNSGVAAQEGELYVVTAASTSPRLRFYDLDETDWNFVHKSSAADLTTATFFYPQDFGVDIAITPSGANAGLVVRAYVPFPITVAQAVLGLEDLSAADTSDIVGFAIYRDADAGEQLYTDNSPWAASAGTVMNGTDVTLQPGMYRFYFCSSDATNLGYTGTTLDDEVQDIFSDAGSDVFIATTANACTAGVPPTTTGALTAAAVVAVPLFKLE